MIDPKWLNQARDTRRGIQLDTRQSRLANEVRTIRRQAIAGIAIAVSFAAVLIGMVLLTTDWFGTGVILMAVGAAAACIADEVAR